MIIRAGSTAEWKSLQKCQTSYGRAYGKAIGSHCVKPIHDLLAAGPFLEMMQLSMFEFGRCNL